MTQPLKTEDFWYSLPDERIAQFPLEQRDQSKLLVVDRQSQTLSDRVFSDLPSLLQPGDLLVLNNTRVLPVRIFGHKSSGGAVEILLIRPHRLDPTLPSSALPEKNSAQANEPWEALTRPGLKPGQVVSVGDGSLTFTCLDQPAEGYARLLSPSLSGDDLVAALKRWGSLPTPPYVKDFTGNPEQYQTIFGNREGSAAAPTASLHFTEKTFADLEARGVRIAWVTLHVGLGTFLPVKVDDVTKHHMHAEWCEVPEETVTAVRAMKANGKRVIAVGTTVARSLETAAQAAREQIESQGSNEGDESAEILIPYVGDTRLFVYPPYQFAVVDALLTNFHLPESTLLMLVSAFAAAPQAGCPAFTGFAASLVGRAYAHAIENKYRFFSFGDAMLLA